MTRGITARRRSPPVAPSPGAVRLGLRENRAQFVLLVLVTAAVGALVGLERTTVPLIGTEVFGLAGNLAVFSFIVAFGLAKALTNLAAGVLTARFRRRQLLLAGWLIGAPVPFVLAWAPSWWWIVAANVLLGVNQGLTWSMTVNMKIDLVGPGRRGLATGLNEAAGYVSVGATALLTGYLANHYGLRPAPELIGVVFLAAGLGLSLLAKDTAAHLALELSRHPAPPGGENGRPSFKETFARTSWRDRSLRGASQAGLVNNLNDGLTWGVFPLLFADHGLGIAAIGLIKGLYPLVWGIGQIPAGHLADRVGRKPLVVTGMLVQAAALLLALLLDRPLLAGVLSAFGLGLGTALVYPALIAAVSDHAHPSWRAHALGTYRFWRDIGYAVGALTAGVLADALGLDATVLAATVLTAASGLLAARWMTDHPRT
ncbi:MFS transporter [Streptomyces sp. JL2001]|uniref:MFS transporter n=1 Tax=unclassified Streptomyces TaxID=2593676 RepID=UPI003676EA31